jgi:hypothetical protein
LVGGVDVGTVKYEKSPGHFAEFVRAIQTGKPAVSNFPGYSGPLAEMVLVGNLAVANPGKKIEWDAKKLRAKNMPELDAMIRPTYKSGYPAI